MLTVADLIRYRMQHERYVRRVAEAVLPTRYGDFRMIAYSSDVDHDQHVALVRGDLEGPTPPLVRVHSHCLTGDVFGSVTCDCSELVSRSLTAIAKEDRGVFLYLHHTGRGFGIETVRSARLAARKSISTSAASSIANPPASAWSSTKAASARKS